MRTPSRLRSAVALLAACGAASIARPLPPPADALSLAEVEDVIERAVAGAQSAGVNAVVSVVDREGTILAAVRTTIPGLPAAPLTATIDAGGVGGLEGVVVPSGVIASTKAGTASYLSTMGNAFTTRTAAYIINTHFPPDVEYQDSGPLFGVQFSSLPQSDISRLPLGLSADPGGVPLYRNGFVVAGVGVEVDGVYTIDPSTFQTAGVPNTEENIAVAAQAGFPPPSNIRADAIFVDGLRLAFQNAQPLLVSTAPTTDFATLVAQGRIEVLVQPRVSPPTRFAPASIAGVSGEIIPDLGASRWLSIAAGEGQIYAVRESADREQRITRVDPATGSQTDLFTLTGGGSGDIQPGEAVTGLAYLDAGTPGAPGDDRLVALTESGRGLTIAVQSGARTPLVSLPVADGSPAEAIGFVDGAADAVFIRTARTARLIRLDPSSLASPAGLIELTNPNDGPIESFTVGTGGVFGVRITPAGDRLLIRIAPTGGNITIVENLTDGGANEPLPGQRLGSLAYDDTGTAAAADDRLLLTNSTLGALFASTLTGDIGAPATAIGVARATPSTARVVRVGGASMLVGPSAQTLRINRIDPADAANPASIVELTPPEANPPLTRAGALIDGRRLSQAEVFDALSDGHALNAILRAMIRRDSPQLSQVTVSVVDREGTLLGCFRTDDAPVFGFDVSVQKARTAAAMSNPNAGAILSTIEGGALNVYVQAAAAVGVNLDGSIAFSDRTGGFLSRPRIPDGLLVNTRGPFSAQPPEEFSVFNTGLQTDLLTASLVRFLQEFGSIGDEGAALTLFNDGLAGAGLGVSDPALPLRNGLQIFPGSVPLYKNGVLVGGVGVSGDGIEQDDFVSFNAGESLQDFGPGVRRADEVFIILDGEPIRLPYVKFPRAPFSGI